MIVPDINLLLYAYDAASPFHSKARTWWQACLSGAETVGLTHVVLFGFVRVATNAKAFRHPLSASEAAAHVRSWLAQPAAHLLHGDFDHAEHGLKLLESLGAAGNLVTDAQIAAIAMEHDATVHTSDSDFMRFPGLRWLNPITAIGSHTLRKRQGL